MTNPRQPTSHAALVYSVIVTIVFSLAVLALALGLYQKQADVTSRLDAAVARLDATARQDSATRHIALCPIFKAFISSLAAQPRDTYPRGPTAYDEDTRNVGLGYLALNCDRP